MTGFCRKFHASLFLYQQLRILIQTASTFLRWFCFKLAIVCVILASCGIYVVLKRRDNIPLPLSCAYLAIFFISIGMCFWFTILVDGPNRNGRKFINGWKHSVGASKHSARLLNACPYNIGYRGEYFV